MPKDAPLNWKEQLAKEFGISSTAGEQTENNRPKTSRFENIQTRNGLPVSRPDQVNKPAENQEYNPRNVFINPYSFIPIPHKEPERKGVEAGDLSGVIECLLEIKSPVIIPNTTSRNKKNEHSYFEFYSYEDLSDLKQDQLKAPANPVVPGSEIRGMVRNIYEQLTNSCFLEVDEKDLPFKRTQKPKRAYLLKYENEVWNFYENPEIYKVNSALVEHLKTGDRVNITEKFTTEKGVKRAKKFVQSEQGNFILHKTEAFKVRNKNNQSMEEKSQCFFNDKSGHKLVAASPDAIERFKNVIESYCEEKSTQKCPSAYNDYKKMFEQKRTILVYADDSRTYLSPACITKEFFKNTVEQLLEIQGKHNKCTDAEHLCPACRLFGMIGKENSNGSRIRFVDSYDASNICFGEKFTLPVLGAPKISATEFYLEKPMISTIGNFMWNYDYYVTYNGKNETRTEYNARLRGRKVYWHGEVKKNLSPVENANMTCTVRPIEKGEFKFKVYFEDVTEEELKNLIFSLTLNHKGLHKIGKGKPVGLGDVKISISSIKERKYEQCGNLIRAYNDENSLSAYQNFELPENEVVKQILTYTLPLSDNEKKLVAYPTNDPPGKIFEWFGKNRGTVRAPMIMHTLPKLTDSNKTLPKFRK